MANDAHHYSLMWKLPWNDQFLDFPSEIRRFLLETDIVNATLVEDILAGFDLLIPLLRKPKGGNLEINMRWQANKFSFKIVHLRRDDRLPLHHREVIHGGNQ